MTMNNPCDLISRAALLAAYDSAHEGPPGRARDLIIDAPPVIPNIPGLDPDPEKVLQAIRTCFGRETCEKCQYEEDCRRADLLREFCPMAVDAITLITLLVGLEPKPVPILHETDLYRDGKCPSCGFPVDTTLYPHFCGSCGQALQWEASDENQL